MAGSTSPSCPRISPSRARHLSSACQVVTSKRACLYTLRASTITSQSRGLVLSRLYTGIGTNPTSMPVGGSNNRLLSIGKLWTALRGLKPRVFPVGGTCSSVKRSMRLCMKHFAASRSVSGQACKHVRQFGLIDKTVPTEADKFPRSFGTV